MAVKGQMLLAGQNSKVTHASNRAITTCAIGGWAAEMGGRGY